MVTPPLQLTLDEAILKENQGPSSVATYKNSEVNTEAPVFNDAFISPSIRSAEKIYMENDSTLPTDLTYSTSELTAEEITGITGELEVSNNYSNDSYIKTANPNENSVDFTNHFGIIELIKLSNNLTSKNIGITEEDPADTISKYKTVNKIYKSGGVNRTRVSINTDISLEENETQDMHYNTDIFTTNIPSSAEITDNTEPTTWSQKDVHQFSAHIFTKNEKDDWLATPSKSSGDGSDVLSSGEEYDLSVTVSSLSGDSIDILPNTEEYDGSLTTLTSSGDSTDMNTEEYNWSVTQPPTSSDSNIDIVSDRELYDFSVAHSSTPFDTDLRNSTDSEEQNFLLEASPVTEIVLDATSNPLDDLGNFDHKIMTTREGLKVDAHIVFDPSQIAKATNYEGSSYSTATRSATVTTWVDPDNRHLHSQQHNLTQPTDLGSPQKSEIIRKFLENIHDTGPNSGVGVTDSTEQDPEMRSTEQYQKANNLVNNDTFASDVELRVEINAEYTTASPDYIDSRYSGKESKQTPEMTSKGEAFDGTSNTLSVGIPILTYNVTDFGNGTQILTKDSKNKTEESLIYEMPLTDATRDGIQLNPSVVIALSVCCSIVVMLGIVSTLLWVFRRHRNRSKVYLSHEMAKPRAFFTKPMNPALLPNENLPNTMCTVEFQRPRAPILLSDDQKAIYFIEKPFVDQSPRDENTAVNSDNNDFVDIPLNYIKTETRTKNKCEKDPPKYDLKYKCENDNDSGIKMWSSTGSLYTASSQHTHCAVPPPPYSPLMGEDTFCLSVHSLTSISKKTEALNV